MKTFIYKIREGRSTYGVNYFVSVYEVENNEPKFLFETKYNSGSYKGHEHQVFGSLHDKGFVSDEIFNKSSNIGYFYGEARDFVKIIQL